MKELLVFLVVLFISSVLAGVSMFEGSFEEGYFIDAETVKVEKANGFNDTDSFFQEGFYGEENLSNVSSLNEGASRLEFLFDYEDGNAYLKTRWKLTILFVSALLLIYVFLKIYGGQKK